jgi:ceramide glucosyltransferase
MAVQLVLGCAAIAAGYQLFQVFAAWRFLRRARHADRAGGPLRPLPPVTILKPLKGYTLDLYANLASFCRQDYPAYQIVFGVSDPADPAVAVANRVKRLFPGIDIVLSIGEGPGANHKVANLRHMMRHARHAVLVASDSDIRVGPGYLRAMVEPLLERDVGLTTCLYRANHVGIPALLESVYVNTSFLPMALTAQMVQRFRYAYGASIAIKREALDRIGGFAAIADYLADDYVLGNRVAEAGYRLVLVPSIVDTMCDAVTLSGMWHHQLRWARTYRVCQPFGWFFSVITHATLWGILSVMATGGAPLGWAMCAGAVGARLLALLVIMRLLDQRDTVRHLWLTPLTDLVASTIWLVGFLGQRVTWGGEVLQIARNGMIVSVAASPARRRSSTRPEHPPRSRRSVGGRGPLSAAPARRASPAES